MWSGRLTNVHIAFFEFGLFKKHSFHFFGCPNGQARVISCCPSIDMNVLTDKTALAVWVLMTAISCRELSEAVSRK